MVKRVMNIIVNVLLVLIVLVCIGIYCATNYMGYSMYVVLSGSMEPTICVDDLVVIKTVNIEDVKENDIITYTENNSYVTHRVVGISKENGISLTMQGDNNNTIDKTKVTKDNIEGIYVTHITGGGNIFYFVHSPLGTTILISVPVALIAIWCLFTFVFKDKDDDNSDDTDSNNDTEDTNTDEDSGT